MKVKVLKNFIYDGAFRLKDEVIDMPTADVDSYERRHWVIRQLQTAPDLPAAKINGLPPLEADHGRKKK